jgi:hypothetical protein
MLQVSLDCPFAIALTGLSNVSFPLVEQGLFFFHSMLSGVPVPQPLALCVVFSPSLFLFLPFFIWTFYCMSS